MKKTLFKDAALITLDPSLGFLEKGDLLIEGAHILEVGPSIEVSGADVVDASDMVIILRACGYPSSCVAVCHTGNRNRLVFANVFEQNLLWQLWGDETSIR